jgi:TolB-like protein
VLSDQVRKGVLQAVSGRDYQVMSRENMAVMAKSQGLDLTCLDGECEVETGRNLAAAYVVSGSVVDMGGTWMCTVKIHETKDGNLLAADNAQGKELYQLADAVPPLVAQLMATALGTGGGVAPAPVRQGGIQPVTAIAPPPPPPSGMLSVDQRLKEQGCTSTAEKRGKAARAAKLSGAVTTAKAQSRQSWSERTQSGELERCTKLPRAERTACITSVEQWLTWARALSVTLPAGEERVQTNCGERVVAYPEEKQVVSTPEITKAEALLGTLKRDVSGVLREADRYYYGEGVTKDIDRAAPLYEKACSSGEQRGCAELANILFSGRGNVREDKPRAHRLMKQAMPELEAQCRAGILKACMRQGYAYMYAVGVRQDNAKGASLYKKACDGGVASGCANLGVMYKYGRGVSTSTTTARRYFKKACDMGFKKACDQL